MFWSDLPNGASVVVSVVQGSVGGSVGDSVGEFILSQFNVLFPINLRLARKFHVTVFSRDGHVNGSPIPIPTIRGKICNRNFPEGYFPIIPGNFGNENNFKWDPKFQANSQIFLIPTISITLENTKI